MLIWVIFAVMTGAAVLALLWPLGRSAARHSAVQDARAVYEAQVAEIARDEGRGLIAPADAELARAEAARRLLRTARDEESLENSVNEGTLRRRRAASAIALSIVPLVTLSFYGAFGSPHLPAEPLSARLSADPARMDMNVALARIETHLQLNPTDGRGWELIAPVYLRAGRYEDAVKAYANAAKHLGPTVERLVDLGEARALAAGGVVTAEARFVIEAARALGPLTPKGRYYLAVAREQDGDIAGAIADLAAMVAEAPPGAPWVGMLNERLARLRGVPAGGETLAALPPQAQQDQITAMVDGLALRLEARGGTAEDWQRLIRSQAVLGRRDAARDALLRARVALAGQSEALAALDEVARASGVDLAPAP